MKMTGEMLETIVYCIYAHSPGTTFTFNIKSIAGDLTKEITVE